MTKPCALGKKTLYLTMAQERKKLLLTCTYWHHQPNFHLLSSAALSWPKRFRKDKKALVTTTLKNCLAVSTKTEHMHILLLNKTTPRYIPNRNAYICSPKGIYKNIYSKTIHNS